MRSIWNIICGTAVANIIALLAFTVWLHASGRIDADRAERIRAMLAETIPAEQQRLAEEAAANGVTDPDADLPDIPPASASEMLQIRLQASEVDRQRVERLRREVEDLQAKLRRDQALLEEQRTELDADREAFSAMRERIQETEGDAQFRKSLAVLQGMKASAAKDTLQALLDDGKRAQVISYLDAMEDRARTKVFTEFIKAEQAQLAAELVEELRQRGVQAAAAGGAP